MNKFFRKLPLQAKLMLIGLIPFCFLVGLTVQIYREKSEKLRLFENYKSYLSESAAINGLIDALQEERKFSFDFAMTKSMRRELLLQRPKTDALLHRLEQSTDPALSGFVGYTKLKDLSSVRNKIDSMTINPNGVMHFYSNTAFRLNTLNTIPPATTAYLQPVYKDLMSQKILSEMITYIGIIRSNIYNVLQTKAYMVEVLMGTMGTYDIYKSYEEELMVKASPEILEQYKNVRNLTAYKPTIDYIDMLFKRFKFDDSYTAPDWWKVSDEGVNQLRQLQGKIWKGLDGKINSLYEDERESRNATLIFLILALAAIFIVVSYIVYIISLTLNDLRRAAEQLANGESCIRIEAESNDVIGSLANSIIRIDSTNCELAAAADEIGKGNFNVSAVSRGESDTLGNAIARMKEDLQQYSRKMEHLVAERTEDLARSNEDLQQFAHVASHDLKEPLRKISTFSGILMSEQKEALTDRGKLFLDKIQVSSQRMSAMIEGVLAYSLIASRQEDFVKVDLNKTIQDIESDLELAIIQKDAKIIYDSLPAVRGVRLLMHQLFYNLINNALKFSKKGVPPVITITSAMIPGKPGSVRIDIADNGIGFSADYAEQIFGVFARLHSKEQYEGTGLGLALCRKIVHRHGGQITAESTKGDGAVFHIVLPAG